MKRGAVKIPDKCSECGHKEGVICKIADIEKDILSEKKGSFLNTFSTQPFLNPF